MKLVRHCAGKPAATDRLYLQSLSHSFTLDFIITGRTKEILENEVTPLIVEFLKERGLKLSEDKTRITHIAEGFDFLGKHIRKYDGKFLTKPSRENVSIVAAKVRDSGRDLCIIKIADNEGANVVENRLCLDRASSS